jgi:tight adherence protein B
MGAFVGLLLGIGLLLVWRSGPRAPVRGERGHRWCERREEALRQAGMSAVSPWQVLLAQLGCAVSATLAVQLMTGALAIAACFGCFGGAAPELAIRRLRARRREVLRELWPEVIDDLTSAVRAGMSLPEALTGLAGHGPAALREPFARFASAYRTNGRFSDCLDRLKHDLADPVGDRVCETLRLAREVGGSDLGVVLRTLSELLRTDARTRAELETRQGWTVNTARQ